MPPFCFRLLALESSICHALIPSGMLSNREAHQSQSITFRMQSILLCKQISRYISNSVEGEGGGVI